MDFEFQIEIGFGNTRTCGAAALSMVYRSYGISTTQELIWPSISQSDNYGNSFAKTHLMVQDALARGFMAIAIRAIDPIQVLLTCSQRGVRAIINHRINSKSDLGHYSVFIGFDSDRVVVHDPEKGPEILLEIDHLLQLWLPLSSRSEITGNVLIGIGNSRSESNICSSCETNIPESVTCPACHKLVPMQPTTLLQCVNNSCTERVWRHIICPFCDCSF